MYQHIIFSNVKMCKNCVYIKILNYICIEKKSVRKQLKIKFKNI